MAFKCEDNISSEGEQEENPDHAQLNEAATIQNRQESDQLKDSSKEVGRIQNEKDIDDEMKLIFETFKSCKYVYLVKKVKERTIKEIPPVKPSAEKFKEHLSQYINQAINTQRRTSQSVPTESDEFDIHYDLTKGKPITDLNIKLGSSDLPRFSCACHKLNLSIRHAITKHKYFINIIKKINTSNKKIRRVIKLSKVFNDKRCRLRLDGLTRWSATFLMLESVLRAINKGAFDKTLKCPVKRKTLEIYHQILKPAYELSISFQSSNSSICDVIPGLYHLIYEWENMDLINNEKRFCTLLISCLKKKFEFELNSDIYQVNNFLKLIV
jgi:hypothetical protein